MKRLILKTNGWYDNLEEPKRFVFFIVVVMGSLLFAQYLMYVKNFIWAFPIWAGIILFWRMSYIIIKDVERYRKNNGKHL